MKNEKYSEGAVINHTAAADISTGNVVALGNRIAVAIADIKSGDNGALRHQGVFTLAKKSTDDISEGDPLFWDEDEAELTLTAAGNIPAGFATADFGNGATEADVKLFGMFAQIEHQADSTADDAAGLVTDFNALLAKLQAAGAMKSA